MSQAKEILLSNKHKGFEQLSLLSYISSLPLLADFFFTATVQTPDSETNENELLSISIKGSVFTDPFLFQLI